MKKLYVVLVACLITTWLQAQVTIVASSIPANTPVADHIYISGTFNNWQQEDPAWILSEMVDGHPAITLNITSTTTIQFKFHRGTWASVEGNASGGEIGNRQHTVSPGQELRLTIQSWKDLVGGGGTGTALPSVSILSSAFAMPELNTTRRIWICLPTDYNLQPAKRYPVIYMHDGQNLFNNLTAFSGEWGIDESMRDLQQQGDRGAIVVGIDNGGGERINEYSPWVNPSYGGGKGDQYVDFLKNTLKPYIDEHYRTLPGPQATGIIGSSMGGLISMYAAAKYPGTFGKAGLLSPSFWFARQSLMSWLDEQEPEGLRCYFVAGTNESGSMVSDMTQVRNRLLARGVPAEELKLESRADGAHSEWFWRREFPAAYQWLFRDVDIPTVLDRAQASGRISVWPNPFHSSVTIGLPAGEWFKVSLTDISGRTLWQDTLPGGATTVELPSEIRAGCYLLHTESSRGIRLVSRVTKVR